MGQAKLAQMGQFYVAVYRLTLPWSTGPVEGQITKLKLIKRQAYGRAGIAFLRQRMLHAA